MYFLGGTISMTPDAGGAQPRLDGAALIATVPGLAALDVELTVHDPAAVPSAALTFDAIAEVVAAARAGGADGVVIVQGTDTIEETAYLADLLWDAEAPIVITGAMRTPHSAGADGPANLLAAITVASADELRGQGALVVFADEVHAARRVHKTHTIHVAAFSSPDSGPLALLVEGAVVPLASVSRLPAVAPVSSINSRVPVLSVAMDDDGEILSALADHCDGLVVAGLGAGHVPPTLAEPLGALAHRVPVVLTSRTGAGPVLSHTYGAVGSETDLLARGLIRGGLLDPFKARTLLRVLLAAGRDHSEVAAEFARRSL